MLSPRSELPAEQWSQRGEQLLWPTTGRYEDAIECFDKAIEICNNIKAKEEQFNSDSEYQLYMRIGDHGNRNRFKTDEPLEVTHVHALLINLKALKNIRFKIIT